MPYKPMTLQVFERYLNIAGWKMVKGSIDHKLYDREGHFMCSIKVCHGKNTKGNEISPKSVKRAENSFKKKGLSWPPKKK